MLSIKHPKYRTKTSKSMKHPPIPTISTNVHLNTTKSLLT